LAEGAPAPRLPPVPPPAKADISEARRSEIAATCRRAGLTVPENHFEQLCAAAPYVEEMIGHLSRSWEFHDEPANVFLFGTSQPCDTGIPEPSPKVG
jgi:aspartyl-tRNA(Asn)/glutamyl-tRNA(Gln) amidotransferase subunit A